MKKETKNSNGTEKLHPEIEAMRMEVVSRELRARLWKADYETAYYTLEMDKIAPAYRALLEKQRNEVMEAEKKRNDILEDIKKNSPGTLSIEEVPEGQEVEGLIPIEIGAENVE